MTAQGNHLTAAGSSRSNPSRSPVRRWRNHSIRRRMASPSRCHGDSGRAMASRQMTCGSLAAQGQNGRAIRPVATVTVSDFGSGMGAEGLCQARSGAASGTDRRWLTWETGLSSGHITRCTLFASRGSWSRRADSRNLRPFLGRPALPLPLPPLRRWKAHDRGNAPGDQFFGYGIGMRGAEGVSHVLIVRSAMTRWQQWPMAQHRRSSADRPASLA